MGGRGAASKMAQYMDRNGKMIAYGTEYATILQAGNIKFVMPSNKNDSVRVPEESRSKGRIYATIGKRNEIKSITKYDIEGKKSLQIDLTHVHGKEKLRPHAHDGFDHRSARVLTASESNLVQEVIEIWKGNDNGFQ